MVVTMPAWRQNCVPTVPEQLLMILVMILQEFNIESVPYTDLARSLVEDRIRDFSLDIVHKNDGTVAVEH